MIDLYALAFTACVLLATPCLTLAYLYGCRVGRLRERAREAKEWNSVCQHCGWRSAQYPNLRFAETALRLHQERDCTGPLGLGLRMVSPAEQDSTFRRRRARA